MKNAGIAIIAILFCILVSAAPAQAEPPIPHAFYGDVTIGGEAAPLGTVVSAKVNGVESGSVITWEIGEYGWGRGSPDYEYQGNLLVQGEHISSGDLIEFYINNIKADQTAASHSGELTELDLTVASAPAPKPAPAEGLSSAAWAGIVIGGLLAVILLVGLGFWLRTRQRTKAS